MAQEKRDVVMLTMDGPCHAFDVEMHLILDDEKRLDASFYAKDVIAAKLLVEELNEKHTEIITVRGFSNDIFWPGRFKRRYTSKARGKPFLMPSEVIMFFPKAKKFVLNPPQDVQVKDKWLLITRSGSIGRCVIVTKLLADSVLTDDLIRVVPIDKNRVGYLYAYLNSWIGQAFLCKDRYGATVKHIEPHHVATIPIPIIPETNETNRNILKAHKLREEAQLLLMTAEKLLYSKLGLPEIDESDVEYFGNKEDKDVKVFDIKAQDLELRLDASYHTPLSHLAVNHLMKAKSGKIEKLGDVADSFVPPRFKRAYVKDPDDGIPLLQGSHIPQGKPHDLRYIWKKMKNLQSYIVKKNWILVTCSGTIGRLSMVRDYWNDWAATNHLLRIVPNQNKMHAGYLVAFLLSVYGQVQFQRLIYGGVVDEIGEAGNLFNEILVLRPNDKAVEKEIGNLVFQSLDKRDRANQIDDQEIMLLEKRLTEIGED